MISRRATIADHALIETNPPQTTPFERQWIRRVCPGFNHSETCKTALPVLDYEQAFDSDHKPKAHGQTSGSQALANVYVSNVSVAGYTSETPGA